MAARNGSDRSPKARPEAAFYCVSSDVYFPGATAMINSLRLVGHGEPIFVCDLGLTDEQRELLAPAATVVEAPEGVQPWLAKAVAPLRHPAETMVLVDADVIATRSLRPLIDEAAAGRVVAFEDNIDRFVPEWGELLDLGPVRRQRYLCSALVAMGHDPGGEVLRLLDDRQRRVEFDHSYIAANVADYPLLYLDQDVLNAIFASRVEADRVVALERRLMATPYDRLASVDERSLRCAYPDGTEPYLLHHILPAKPWLKQMGEGVYSRLLRRLLIGPDLAIRVPERDLPLRLRSGAIARAARRGIDARDRLGWIARRRLPDSLLGRLESTRG
jgi:hypothetical protein